MFTLVLKPLYAPLLLTVLGWFGLLLWPLPADRGAFGIGAIITAAVRLGIGIVGTLVLWLIYCLLVIGGVV